MADIRINSLPTTASSSSSDDFLALDGTTNGTRKLNAYSPSFGGNATVGGTLTVSGGNGVYLGASNQIFATSPAGQVALKDSAGTAPFLSFWDSSNNNRFAIGAVGTAGYVTSVAGNLILQASSVTAATFSGANTTLAGNLTVSGTGTSTIASATLFRATTGPGGVFTLQHGDGSADTRALFWPNGAFALALRNGAGTGSYYIGATAASSPDLVFSANSGTENARLTNGGNLLLGTTTDGGQKLQVAGTAYVSSTLETGGNLTVGSGSGTIRLAAANGSKGQYTTDGTNTYLDYIGSIAIRSLPTYNPALTLDSSQNATFAGQAIASGDFVRQGAAGGYRGLILRTNTSRRWFAAADDAAESGSNVGSDFKIVAYDDSGNFLSTPLTIQRSTGNATFAGAIAIGNTVNTVSPTSPNRTITMVIGGTTYYIAAKTTND